MFDVQVGACCFEGMAAEGQLLRPHLLDVLGRPAIAGRVGEVRAPFDCPPAAGAQDRVAGEHRVDLVGHGGSENPEEIAGYAPGGLLVQRNEACPEPDEGANLVVRSVAASR